MNQTAEVYNLFPKSESRKWNFEYFSEELEKIKTRVDVLETVPAYSVTDLFGHIGEGYVLMFPIKVTLEIYPDETLAIIPTLELYEEGSTEIEAVANLKLALIDLFEELNPIPDENLGEELRNRKKTINGLISK